MDSHVIVFMIPIIGILAGCGTAVAGIIVLHRQRMQRTKLRHRERIAAIEKGMELPPDPPEVDPRQMDSGRFLRQGLVLMAVGGTVTAGMMQLPDPNVPYLFGFVPAAIGAALLLYYFIHARHTGKGAATQPPQL